MTFKITIEVDGQSEEQLAPLVAKALQRLPPAHQAPAAPPLLPADSTAAQNALLLQQRVVQLAKENRLLAAQLARQNALTIDSRQGAMQPSLARPPALPARHRSSKQIHKRLQMAQLKNKVIALSAQLWRSLVWCAFGNERLLLFLLLCAAVTTPLLLAPLVTNRLWPAPEFVESSGTPPGDAAEDTAVEENPKPTDHQQTTTPPSPAASKAGSHPPPPPAFAQ